MATIAVLGTLDTKGAEHAFVAECIRGFGHTPLLIDVGTQLPPTVQPDISREEIWRLASELDFDASDRGQSIAAMSKVAAILLQRFAIKGSIQGVISLGGSGGTAIGTAAMRALPLGFPKVMVSTLASGNASTYVRLSDIVMFPSIVDVSGINRFSRGVFVRAAASVCAMVDANDRLRGNNTDRPLVVASMFGNTTKCVEEAKHRLEAAGYEVLVFHATGWGGRTMESLIKAGIVAGVLDVTTTEWADEFVGGILSAGPNRLSAAANYGVPAIVVPGCLDMVNFGEPSTVPPKFAGRTFYQHNPQVTLMRTTPEECWQLGMILAEKVNQSSGPVTVLIPRRAISLVSARGQPFHDEAADRELFQAIKDGLRPDIPLIDLDLEINDPLFAAACVSELLKNMKNCESG